ncbi:immunoglobulin-like domain-containing protein [Labilibaculum euxinus]
MKRLLYIPIFLLFITLFSACDDKETEGISRVTFFPILTMSGDEIIVLNVGDTYTEAGVTATTGENEIDVTIDGNVNATVPGIYQINYVAFNEDGFSATALRQVIVQDLASIAGTDFTGTYKRTFYGTPKNGGFSEWVAGDVAGLYKVNDVGGVDGAGYEYDLTVYQVAADKFVMPVQPNEIGGTIFASSTAGGSSPDVIDMTATGYIWSVKGAGYGTNPRTFEKQ